MTRTLALQALLFATALAIASGCGSSGEEPAPETTAPETTAPETTTPEATDPEPTTEPGRDLALEALDPALDEDGVEARPTPLRAVTLDVGVCEEVADAPVRAIASASALAIVGGARQFFVAGYERVGAGERVTLVALVPGEAARLVAAIPIERPAERRSAAPGLALVGPTGSAESSLGLAWTDGAGDVFAAFLDPSRAAPRPIALGIAHADPRFSPAVARASAARLVAVTTTPSSDTGALMHVELARVGPLDALEERSDLTPRGGGAHPLFVTSDAGRVELFFVEPRVAISVLQRVTFDADATASAPEVVRSVQVAAEPPSFAVARHEGVSWLAYTAVGSLASRAVGIVTLEGTEDPTALVPGLGYGGAISVRAATRRGDAIFAMEAPSGRDRDAAREVRLRAVWKEGESRRVGEPLVFANATRPSIAVDAEGVIAVALEGGLVRFARCGEPR